MDYTHIIHRIPSQETACLFRASDGMMLAECQQLCVIKGENPMKRESRLFVDHEHSYRYLRALAANDLGGPPLIEEVNLEGTVILAPGSVEMITNGGRYPSVKGFNKSLKQ